MQSELHMIREWNMVFVSFDVELPMAGNRVKCHINDKVGPDFVRELTMTIKHLYPIFIWSSSICTATHLVYVPDVLTPESNYRAPNCNTKLILKSVCVCATAVLWNIIDFHFNETQHETRIKCLTLFLTSCNRVCCYFLVI